MVNKVPIRVENSTIMITGIAGFIGSSLAYRLLKDYTNISIIGIDNFSDYYDIKLKEYRISRIEKLSMKKSDDKRCFTMIRGDIADKKTIEKAFADYCPNIIINLAAQAGVRYSINNPDVYITSNIIGFYNILEGCRNKSIDHLVYASSSSVYGGNTKVPFSIQDDVDHPVSLYAATKKSNELIAHAYSKLYNIPCTGLRFFTVYGPAGRPDMAYFSFTDRLRKGEKIDVYNYGNCKRDFTYIDDIVEGIIRVIKGAPIKKNGQDGLPIPPYALYNIGGENPENLLEFVHILAEELVKADVLDNNFIIDDRLNLVPMQPGDVPITFADSSDLYNDYGFKPEIDLRTGLRNFSLWYRDYYG